MKDKKRLWLGMAAAFLSALLVAAACEGKLPMAKADEVTVVAAGVCGANNDTDDALELYNNLIEYYNYKDERILQYVGPSSISWQLESDGTLTIFGSGYMEDFDYEGDNDFEEWQPWGNYRESIRKLVIEEGVISIGCSAFRGCKNMETVSLPESLLFIYDGAFRESGIRQVRLPSGLKKVENNVFRDCVNLTGLEMGPGIQKVGQWAFKGCISLKSVSLPAADAWWGYAAFAECSSLEKAEFAEGFAFKPYWTKNGNTHRDSSWDSGCAMFYNCKRLKEVILPESLSELPTGFFWGCKSLPREYVLRGSAVWSTCVPDMGEEEFTLPSYVRRMTCYSMAGNKSVRRLIVLETVEVIEKWAFEEDKTVEEVVLPRHVVWDTKGAFDGNKNLKKVTLPEDITKLGDYMFYGCTSLERFTVPEGVKKMRSVFYNCTNLKEVKLPQSLESLNGTFLNCRSLKEIKIPKGVTKLGKSAFEGCKRLKKTNIPKGVTKLGDYAFADCVSLEKITLPEGLIKIGNGEYGSDGKVFKNCKSLKEIRLPGKLTSIERKTFMGCRKLKTVYIESKRIKSVGYDAFKGIHKNACIYVPKGKMKSYKKLIKKSGAKMKGWTWKYL